jgi:hypothetical protein
MAAMLRISIVWAVCAAFFRTIVAEPFRLHPVNPHYFLFRGAPTVLVTAAEHYGALVNLDFDYVPYFAELKSKHLNLTKIFSGIYVEEWGKPWNTLAPLENRFVCPWARSSVPGYVQGGNKFDLTKWDDSYFVRLHDIVQTAGTNGIVVEMALFSSFYSDIQYVPLHPGNNINDFGEAVFVPDENPRLWAVVITTVKKIVTELKDFDNVYYVICNEPYFSGIEQTDIWNTKIIEAVRSVSPDQLISINIGNGDEIQVATPVHKDIGMLNFHYAPPNIPGKYYDLYLGLAFDESGWARPKCGTTDCYRQEAWEFMCAGGSVYNGLDWTFTAASETGQDMSSTLNPKDPKLRTYYMYLADFLNSFEFVKMKPDKTFIKGGAPDITFALANPGNEYAVYMESSKVTLSVQLPEGKYTVEWMSTVTGGIEAKEEATLSGTETKQLSSPSVTGQLALAIRKVRPVTAPGAAFPARDPAFPGNAEYRLRIAGSRAGHEGTIGNAWDMQGCRVGPDCSCSGVAIHMETNSKYIPHP